jgi:hypothetical protein
LPSPHSQCAPPREMGCACSERRKERQERHEEKGNTPHVRDPVSVIQPLSPPLHTHSAHGLDVCTGRQQDLRHLHMPTGRRHVKWGALVLRGGRSGKNDTQRNETPLM